MLADINRVLHRGEHPETEEVDLHDSEIFTVILIPLQDGAARHGRRLEGDDVIEPIIADYHASRMLAEVPRGM